MAGDLELQALDLLRRLTRNPHAAFRDGQLVAISTLVEARQRVLCVQRTGWGKSAVYFIATALLRTRGSGPTLLISPLLALMRNQIAAAQDIGIEARTVNSSNRDEWEPVFEELRAGMADLLLNSPERLNNPRFRAEVLPTFIDDVAAPRRGRGALHQRLGARLQAGLPVESQESSTGWARTPQCCARPRPPTIASWPTSRRSCHRRAHRL